MNNAERTGLRKLGKRLARKPVQKKVSNGGWGNQTTTDLKDAKPYTPGYAASPDAITPDNPSGRFNRKSK